MSASGFSVRGSHTYIIYCRVISVYTFHTVKISRRDYLVVWRPVLRRHGDLSISPRRGRLGTWGRRGSHLPYRVPPPLVAFHVLHPLGEESKGGWNGAGTWPSLGSGTWGPWSYPTLGSSAWLHLPLPAVRVPEPSRQVLYHCSQVRVAAGQRRFQKST
jgi:hypothetical protein